MIEISRYKIMNEIGSGGMGKVFKAYDKQLQRYVALKTISEEDPSYLDRFEKEALILSKLKHPNIVEVYDYGIYRTIPFLVMELVEGKTLSDLIKISKLDIEKTLKILIKISQALSYVHSEKILHRDLKPDNIMITKNDEPKLMDFGVARIKTDTTGLTQKNVPVGTLAYMSPEQFEGSIVDGRADVYSMGATLYEVLTGIPPFHSNSHENLLYKISQGEFIRPRELNQNISIYLEAICLKCLQKEKRNRYSSANRLSKDLENFIEKRPIVAQPYTWFDHLKKVVARNKQLTAVIISIFIFLLFSVVVLLYSNIKITEAKEQERIAKEKEKREKETSEKVSKAVISSLERAYSKHLELQNDQYFLTPIQNLYKEVPSLNENKKYRWLKGLVFGLSKNPKKMEIGIAEYTQLIRTNKNDADAYNNRGAIYFEQGEYQKALDDYNKAIEIDGRNFSALTNRGNVYQRIGQLSKAIKDFDESIQINPTYAIAYNNRAIAYTEMNMYSKALDDANKALALKPDYSEGYRNRGNIYCEMGEYKKALKDFDHAIINTNHPEIVYSNRALVYEGEKQYELAFADYALAIKFNPKYSEVYANRGELYKILKQYEKSLLDYEKAIELDPQRGSFYSNRAAVHFEMNNLSLALEDYSKSIEFGIESAFTFNNRGLLHYKQGNLKEALNDYKKAITMNPNYSLAYHNRALVYEKLGKYQEALDNHSQAIKINNKYYDALFSRGVIYQNQASYEKALQDYTRALDIEPNEIVYYNRGTVYHKLRQLSLALKDYNLSLEMNDKYAYTYKNRGILFYDLGNFRDALSDWEKVVKLEPSLAGDLNVYINTARSFLK